MIYRVDVSASARADIVALRRWIGGEAGAEAADHYLDRLEAHLDKLASFPNRGTPRDELLPGVRSVTFERRQVIFYHVVADTVEVLRVLDGPRDIAGLLR